MLAINQWIVLYFGISHAGAAYIANATVWENADCSGSQTTIEIDVSSKYCFNVSGRSFSHFSESPSYASKYNVGCDVFTFSDNQCFYSGTKGPATCAHFGPGETGCQENFPPPENGQCVAIPFASIELSCLRYTGDA